MNEGEKYLNISLSVGKALELAEYAKNAILEGKTHVAVPAFPASAKNPSLKYSGDGVTVWEQTVKEKTEQTEG